MTVEQLARIERALALVRHEATLRDIARQIELSPIPNHQQEARRAFRRASAARRLRMSLLRSCDLI